MTYTTVTRQPTGDEGPLLSNEDVAVLLGVTVEQLRACVEAQADRSRTTQRMKLPDAWVEQGRSRCEIYKQATGRDDMQGAIEFWRRLAAH